MNATSPYGTYISARSRARITKALLIAGAIVGLLSMFATGLELMFPELSEEGDLTDNIGGLVAALLLMGLGLLQILILITTIVFFLMWLYRSYENLRAFGNPPNTIDYSSGWAVGSFFVPFVNLVVPYRAIKELWRKSEPYNLQSFGAVSPPAWFPLWWAFWLISNIADNAYFRLTWRGNASRETLGIVGIAADGLGIIAAILAVVVIGEIDQRQQAASKSMALGQPSEPPLPPYFDPPLETAAFNSN